MKQLIALLFIANTLIASSISIDIPSNTKLSTKNSFHIKSKDDIFPTNTTYSLKKFLNCSVGLDVIYKIKDAKTIEVIPRDRFLAGKEYQCTLVKQNYKFIFKTKDITLEKFNYFEDDKSIRLEFNSEIKVDSLKKKLNIIKHTKLTQTKLQYKVSSHDGRVFVLSILEPTGKDVKIVIDKGLESINGSFSKQKVEKVLSKYSELDYDVKSSKTLSLGGRYILFEDEGKFGLEVRFSDYLDGSNLDNFVEIDGINNLQVNIYRSTMTVSSNELQADKTYTIRFLKGIKSKDGTKVLKENIESKIKTPNHKKSIHFTSGKEYVSSLGSIGLETVNIDKATLVVKKVLNDNYRYMTNISSYIYDLTQEVFSKDIELSNPKNKYVKNKIILKELEGKLSNGVYEIEIFYNNDYSYVSNESKIIYVSDIGISTKLSKDQLFVSLSSLSKAKPIDGATIHFYSHNNSVLGSAISNKDGIAILDNKTTNLSKLGSIIVSTATDRNFLRFKYVNVVQKGSSDTDSVRYLANVYLQSKIIRPGATVNALITIKDKDFISASNIPIKIEIIKGRKTIYSGVHNSDEFGLIDFSKTISSNHTTGFYHINVSMGKDEIGSARLSIESFMPPKIENIITTDKKEYLSSDIAKIDVISRYLHGMPASSLKGKVTLIAKSKRFTSKAYPEFDFINDEIHRENLKTYISMEEDIKLDKKGKVELLLPLKSSQNVPSILEATIGATIMDDTQPVSKYTTINIYPYSSMVGVKLSSNSLSLDKDLIVNTVLINPINNNKIDRELTVVIKKKIWFYNYINNRYTWEYRLEEFDRFKVKSNSEFKKSLGDYGNYVIEVHDRLSGHSSSSIFKVSGWNYKDISPTNSSKKVKISFDNREYKVGEVVKATFNTPILNGLMLVTLEGDKVYWHKVIEYTNGKAKVDIPLGEEFKRGIYIHATSIRDTKTDSSLVPFRTTGYAYVKKDRRTHKIDLSLDHLAVTPSKKSVQLNIKSSKDSAILVSVVDKGILNILGQETPKLFSFFNKKEKKYITHLDLYDNVIHHLIEGNILDFGADKSKNKRKKHLPPENSDRVKPFMLWSNILYTKDKEASFELDIPEFAGEAIIVAIAVNKDSIGVTSSSIVIKDDIMIKPSFPRFALKGDKMEIPVRVFNTTNNSKSLTLNSNTSRNFSLKYDTSIVIPAKSSKVIKTKLEALEEGKGYVEFSINDDNKTFTKKVELLTLSPFALQSKTYKGATSVVRDIKIPKKFIGGNIDVTISNNLIGSLRGDLKYLMKYPYGCAEQISSKISAMFYYNKLLKGDTLLKDVDFFIQSGMNIVASRQNISGEISYWRAGGYVNKDASLYAIDTLLMLSRNGYTLDKNVKSMFISNLQSIAKGIDDFTYDVNLRIYAAFILAENNYLEVSTANMMYKNLLSKADHLDRAYLAAIFVSLGEHEIAEGIYSKTMRKRISTLFTQSRSFSSRSSNIAKFFNINSKYFKKDYTNYLDANREFKKIYSTYDKALAVKALYSYLGKESPKKMSVELNLNGNPKILNETTTYSTTLKSKDISIYPLSGITGYSFDVYKNIPYELKNHSSNIKNMDGIEVTREFIDKDGKPVDLKNLVQGSRIYSKMNIINFKEIDNVVINQRFPACMEIINSRVSKGSHKFNNNSISLDNKDIRDDRVLYFLSLEEGKHIKNYPIYISSRTTTIYTPLIVTTKGEFGLPAVIVESMYDPKAKNYVKEVHTVVVK
jgi:alpha-2-macroglobulin